MRSLIDMEQSERAEQATWSVPPEWRGKTVYIIGGGPSLTGFDPTRLIHPASRVIVINKAVLPCGDWPGVLWADVFYFCDGSYWRRDGARIREIFHGDRIVTMAKLPAEPDILRLTRFSRLGLSDDPRQLAHGGNSGYQSINLAYLFGARRIVLLGFDMTVAPDGRTHVHDGYGREAHVQHQLTKVHLPKFASLKEPLERAGVEVINASRNSLLDVWPRMTIDEALAL